jgi:hypothetical protein
MKLLKDLRALQLARINNCIPFLLFTWITTSLILTSYSSYLTGFIPPSKFHREFLICGGQILFQFFVIQMLDKNKIGEYLISMMTISFLAGLALLVFIGIGKLFLITDPIVYMVFFLLIVCTMFLFHLRRMKILQLNLVPSATWVLYRLFVLTFIL